MTFQKGHQMHLKYDISESELRSLYSDMSIREIAKKFDCSYCTIRMKLVKYNIKRRFTGGISVLPDGFNNNCYAFSYMHGVAYGDASIREGDCLLVVKDVEFRDKFAQQACLIGFHPTSFLTKEGYFGARICNRAFNRFLHRHPKINTAFIEGFIDSEACVAFYTIKGYFNRRVFITNNNVDLLNEIQAYMMKHGIGSKIYVSKKSNSVNWKKPLRNNHYFLYIGGKENLMKFHSSFSFIIKRKQDKLDAIVKSYEVS